MNLSLNLKPLRIKDIKQNIMEKALYDGVVMYERCPTLGPNGVGCRVQMGQGPNRATLP